MRRTRVAGLLLGAAILFFGPVLAIAEDAKPASPAPAPRTITTTGVGKVKVPADAVRLSLVVNSTSGSVKEARTENDKQLKRIQDGIAALKIPGLKVSVASEEMEPQWQPDVAGLGGLGGGQPVLLGYQARSSIAIVIKGDDVPKLREAGRRVLDSAIENGAQTPSSVDANPFERMRVNWRAARGIGGYAEQGRSAVELVKEDTTETRRKALTLAAQDAIANAKALAGGAEVRVLQLTTTSEGYEAQLAEYFAAQPDSDGNIEVTCRVQIVCTY